jgi:sodium/hydrogen exchanger-like protein 6/7/sodium/hydrogen exchanger 8
MFKTLDENYVKPFLIYNYVERKNDIIIAKKLEKNKHRFEKE